MKEGGRVMVLAIHLDPGRGAICFHLGFEEEQRNVHGAADAGPECLSLANIR